MPKKKKQAPNQAKQLAERQKNFLKNLQNLCINSGVTPQGALILLASFMRQMDGQDTCSVAAAKDGTALAVAVKLFPTEVEANRFAESLTKPAKVLDILRVGN